MDPTRSRPSGRRPATGPLWLVYAGAIAIVAILGLAEATVVLNMRESTLRNTEANLHNISVALADQANRAFQGLDLVLVSVADAIAADAAADGTGLQQIMSSRRVHRMLQERLTGLPYINAVNLIDPTGKLVNFSRYWPIPNINVADRDYFKAMQANPTLQSFISEPMPNRADGTWTIYLAHRIRGRDGSFAGLVLGAVELRYFEDIYRIIAPDGDLAIALLRSDGVLLARYPHGEAVGSIVPPNALHALSGSIANAVLRGFSQFDEHLRISATRQLGNFPIAVLVSQSETTALADWTGMVWVLGVVTAGSAASILIAAVAIGHRWRQQQALALERAERAEVEQARAVAETDLARERERHAEEASRAKSGFLAMMSHEIRTPMNAVLGLAGTLLDSPLPPQQRSVVTAIRDSGDSLLRLLNDILDFSKLDAGRMTLEAAPFSPIVVTHNTISILGPRATAKGLSITAETDPDVPPALLGDAGRIRQVLLNLVSNAVKFTEAGKVGVHAACLARTATTATIEWTVSDTGIGIAATSLDTLFGEFVQADSSITRRFGGSGLGLAISKRLLDRMGGTIAVESTPGKGTTFRVRLTLPIADHAPLAAPAHRSDISQAFTDRLRELGRPLRVLFAEDNPTNQLVALQLLKGFNVQVDVVADGLEAVDAASSFLYDVICMDVRMPELDGLQATRLIRRRGGQLATVPIVALTANAFPEDVQECFAAGMNQFVPKPVHKDVLVNAILEALIRRAPLPRTADPEDALLPATPLAAAEPDALATSALHPPDGRDADPMAGALACDTGALGGLTDDLGEQGVAEMLALFESETRARLARLAAGITDARTLLREVHTLKGAAGTVCAARLAARAAVIEARVQAGGTLADGDLPVLTAEFEVWLEAVRALSPGAAQLA